MKKQNSTANTEPPNISTSVEDELESLGKVITAFKGLDVGAQTRILLYLKERFSIYIPS